MDKLPVNVLCVIRGFPYLMDVPVGESNAMESFWTGSPLAMRNMTGRHEDAMTVVCIEVVFTTKTAAGKYALCAVN